MTLKHVPSDKTIKGDKDLEIKELNSLLVSGWDLLLNSELNFVDRIKLCKNNPLYESLL